MSVSKMKTVKLPFDNKLIFQDINGHGITTDTRFLVDTVLNDTVCLADLSPELLEIGTGNGIIAIMLALHRQKWRIKGIEVQISDYNLACRNIKSCDVDIELQLSDVRKHHIFLGSGKYDIIVSNPPYYKAGEGKLSKSFPKNISRFELLCDMNDILDCISHHLKPEGKAYLLYPKSREEELEKSSKQHHLQIASKYDVLTNDNSKTDSPKTVFVIQFGKSC